MNTNENNKKVLSKTRKNAKCILTILSVIIIIVTLLISLITISNCGTNSSSMIFIVGIAIYATLLGRLALDLIK